MNNSEWQDIQAIHMSIQSVDLHNIGIKMDRELRISCGLINIARGQCNSKIAYLSGPLSQRRPIGGWEV